MASMSLNALAVRIKRISGGKGQASKIKMLTFYYALKAAQLFSLASFALGRLKIMDAELFSELTADLGLIDGIENKNQIIPDNENENDDDNEIEIIIESEEKEKKEIEVVTKIKVETQTPPKIKVEIKKEYETKSRRRVKKT